MKLKSKRPTQLPTPISKAKIRKKPYRKSYTTIELQKVDGIFVHRKLPGMSHECLTLCKYQDDKATALIRCMTHIIRCEGLQVERISSTNRITSTRKSFVNIMVTKLIIEGMKRIPSTRTKNIADIALILAGKCMKIKKISGIGWQNWSQNKHHRLTEKECGIYVSDMSFKQLFWRYNEKFGRKEK